VEVEQLPSKDERWSCEEAGGSGFLLLAVRNLATVIAEALGVAVRLDVGA
jgi:hypothetical protein